MGVRRLPAGAWQARIQVQGRRLTGTFATRDEAEEWEVLTHAQASQGRLPSLRHVYSHMLEASSPPAAAAIDAVFGDLG